MVTIHRVDIVGRIAGEIEFRIKTMEIMRYT